MKIANLNTIAAVVVLTASTITVSSAVAAEDDTLLHVTTLEVKLGHLSTFREGVNAYKSCYSEHDGNGSWSAWAGVDGKAYVYHIVSQMESWAEMDADDPASKACYSVIEEQIAPHLNKVSNQFSRRLPEWSGSPGEYDVVRLHQFRVDDNDEFQAAVSAITTVLKDAKYPHQGTWYRVIGADSNDPSYFVVAHYKNFADIDADRDGVYKTVVKHAGQEQADAMWKRFGDSLRDDWEYFTELLRRDSELGHSTE